MSRSCFSAWRFSWLLTCFWSILAVYLCRLQSTVFETNSKWNSDISLTFSMSSNSEELKLFAFPSIFFTASWYAKTFSVFSPAIFLISETTTDLGTILCPSDWSIWLVDQQSSQIGSEQLVPLQKKTFGFWWVAQIWCWMNQL